MTTRATPLAEAHVQALNQIDIEFTEPKEKKIREAWALLLNFFSEVPVMPNKPLPNASATEHESYTQLLQTYNVQFEQWNQRITDQKHTLLEEMSTYFQYGFDKMQIRGASYYPRLHGTLENERLLLLKSANDVLTGERPLGIYVINPRQ